MNWSLKTRLTVMFVAGTLVSTSAAVAVSAYVQWGKLVELAEQESRGLSASVVHAVEAAELQTDRQMLAAARFLAQSDSLGPLTNQQLSAFAKELQVDDLYLADKEGVFTQASQVGSVGFNLFSVAPIYKDLVTGKQSIIDEPLKLRAEDGKTAKFLAVPRKDRNGFVEVAVTVDSIARWWMR